MFTTYCGYHVFSLNMQHICDPCPSTYINLNARIFFIKIGAFVFENMSKMMKMLHLAMLKKVEKIFL